MTLPISTEHARELARLSTHGDRPDLVLIGAVALGHHVPLQRMTSDVDLALVAAPDDMQTMLTSLGWRRDPFVHHRWHGPNNFRADVLPATQELIRAGRVEFDRDAKTMSLVGFDLAFEHASEVELPGTASRVNVASLASIVVLKVVAWLDRPHDRTRDLGDLVRAFENALSHDDDRRWDDSHPVGSSGLDFDDQSPFFVGLDVGAIAGAVHRKSLDAFVDKLLDASGSDAAAMARAAGLTGADADLRVQRLVEMFAKGMRHEHASK